MIDIKEDYSASPEEAKTYVARIVDKLAPRFTKSYSDALDTEDEKYYEVQAVFQEPKIKKPITQYKVVFFFKVPKSLKDRELLFNLENESVFYPLFDSINLQFFQSFVDRVILNKEVDFKKLLLQTNFESTRMLDLAGDPIKLFTDIEAEDILSNNNSDYFFSDIQFKPLASKELVEIIRQLWKALISFEDQEDFEKASISFTTFKQLFIYGELDFSEENMAKLWKYCQGDRDGKISFVNFNPFCLDLIQCLRANEIATYKKANNKFISNKINKCVEIMSLHFKEFDFDENEEISYENLKKCLLKENELFTRKEIEIILEKVNHRENFEFWKFEKILEILYRDHFDYRELIKCDKIYKYLIDIFSRQDTKLRGKIHYKKMKQALMIEPKLKLNKTQILTVLNFFDINKNPEIDYYSASLTLRDIVQELFSPDMSGHKLELQEEGRLTYHHFEDTFDSHEKAVKQLFAKFDTDFDHMLDRSEFARFLLWLLPFLDQWQTSEIFDQTRMDAKKISFKNFKQNFHNLMNLTRIKQILRQVYDII